MPPESAGSIPQSPSLRPVGPVNLVHLFPGLHRELMSLLRNLKSEDWSRPTACAQWSVKDIVAHLLDTCLRRLSFGRDALDATPSRLIASYADLVGYLNQLNADWVTALRRVSPRLLMDFLDLAEPQLHRYLASLDPEAPATFGVAWAGEERSVNWFDIAREYTERWLHQQQIREAVAAPGLTARSWLYPALDIFVRALPFTYREVQATPGATVRLEITGDAGGVWTLARGNEAWTLLAGDAPRPTTRVTVDQDAAWKLFTKGLTAERARRDIAIDGDLSLGRPVLGALGVMA
jgi:uncharacterized protein (TIGR03083 family)